MRSTSILLVFGLIAAAQSSAELPREFIGSWRIEVQHAKGFPWWRDMKFPVTLEISDHGVVFTDQSGAPCEPPTFLYDPALDAVVFNHCLPMKHSGSIATFYRARLESGRLLGETWTYKPLFRWVGDREE